MIAIISILIVYIAMVVLGVVQISSYHLVVSTESANKLYDGEPITADGWEIVEGKLAAGHTAEARMLGTQTEVGVSDNNIALTIFDSEGADVTSKYTIEYRLGQLAINGKALEFSSGSAEKEYDGEPLTNSECELVSGELLEGHVYTAYATGSITTVGETENTIEVTVIDTATGADVTSYYFLDLNEGTLKISSKRLVLSGEVSKILGSSASAVEYNGFVVSGELPEGYRIMCEPIEANGGKDAMCVYVLDADGNDVTDLFEVVIAGGDLSVTNPETFFSKNTSDYENAIMAAMGAAAASGKLPLDTPVYKVLAEQNGVIYLRACSYGNYDGNDWTNAPTYMGISPFTYATDALARNGKQPTTVKVTPLFSGLPLSMPYYYVGGDYVYTSDSNDVGVGEDEVTEANVTYTYNYIPYTYKTSAIYQTGMTVEEMAYYSFVLNNYLGVDEETKVALQHIAAENGISASDPEVIEKVVSYIQNAAVYNMKFKPFPSGVNNVIYFLTEAKEGICQHYAASATLMFRSLGIPARYVTGFMAEALAGEEVTVTAKQCHAWVEVYIEGFGWIQLEVTGSVMSGGGSGEAPSGFNGSGVMGEMPSDMSADEAVHVATVTIRQKGTYLLRTKSFGEFDGVNWLAPNTLSKSDLQGLISEEITPFTVNLWGLMTLSSFAERDMQITMVAENYPYMLPYFATAFTYIETNDSFVDSTYNVGQEYTIRYTYYDYLTSGAVKVGYQHAMMEEFYRSYVYGEYTKIDEKYKSYFTNLGISAGSPDIVNAVKNYIMNAAKFDEDCTSVPEGEDGVFYFLETSKKGISRHFATAATLMYRALGVPARYTVGYEVESTGQSKTAVYTSDLKAWVEVYLDGTGWVPVDVTPEKVAENNDVRITVLTASASKTYDGAPLVAEGINWNAFESRNSGWTYDAATGICRNTEKGYWFDTATVVTTGSQTSVNESGATNGVKGLTLKDANGQTVDSNIVKINCTGKLVVNPIVIKLQTKGAEITDSEQKYFEEYEVLSGSLLEGHTLVVNFTYNASNPVPEDSVVENTIASVDVLDASGQSVFAKIYKVIYGTNGELVN